MEINSSGNLVIHPDDKCYTCRYSGMSKAMVIADKICPLISLAYHGYVRLPFAGNIDEDDIYITKCPMYVSMLKEVKSSG